MECRNIDYIRDLLKNSVISPIKYGDNERSRLSGMDQVGN